MAYVMINGIDYSMYCNQLKVNSEANYNAQTNAAGNTVVEYINKKRTIEVGIIPLKDEVMINLMVELDKFNIVLSYRDPRTNQLENIQCIIPSSNIEYYTIQANNVSYNALTLSFIEL